MKKYFYEKNEELICDYSINKTFEEVLWMTDDEFVEWIINLRKRVVYLWDNYDIPPRVGYSEKEIIHQFESIEGFYDTNRLIEKDLLTGDYNVIRTTNSIGNAVNQWFPTMMKTKIAYNKNAGLSIYDHFKDDKLLPKVITYAKRHFKRDSFYHYSHPVRRKSIKNNLISANSGIEWIQKFESKSEYYRRNFDYWLESINSTSSEYTGYNQDLVNAEWLYVSLDELCHYTDLIPNKCMLNVDPKRGDLCRVRFFKYGQRIFPIGLKAFRISWCQYAANFPPLTAKFLYETYTDHILLEKGEPDNPIIIWDPSSGWGGRLLGAMSIKFENDKGGRSVHYIGTDPNTDHNTTPGRTKYHELADFYNTKCSRGNFISRTERPVNTYEIFQCGSEEMRFKEQFQKYKGEVDIVLTSPPYFCKEIYSDDQEQSCHKFKTFDAWVDGFLKPTLEIAVEWLAPKRYLLWNISDISLGNNILPLEETSKMILSNLGMRYDGSLKMVLAQMPGSNRIDHNNAKQTMTRHLCKIIENDHRSKIKQKIKGQKELWFKYEPIQIWFKE